MDQKKVNVHMIGNAHIDPVWLWQWQEGFQAVWSTFRSTLDRMKETPDFIFTCAQAAVFKWMEKADPEMFEEIKQRVKEGRWRIVGGWWMQPDCNIPSGESFARQALYAQRYFKEHFGVLATIGYNVDSFGHNGMLPQLLKKSGLDHYVFMRPGTHEKEGIPNLFWWQSADGSRVLAYRIEGTYAVRSHYMEEYTPKLAALAPEGIHDMMEFYGVGNHGGGPTKENIKFIEEMDGRDDMPGVLFSHPELYFETLLSGNPELPLLEDDLQHHASGCYSVNAWVKAINRKSEQLLASAEKFSTLSAIKHGLDYPYKEYGQAWENVLFNQFHDIMAGSSIKESYEDARDFYGESLKLASEGLNYALNAIIRQIDTTGEGIPLIVFNPLSWTRRGPIEFEMQGMRFPDNIPQITITDENGKAIPCQIVRPSAIVGTGRLRMVFVDDLPAMGYKTYRIFTDPTQSAESKVAAQKYSMENQYYHMEFDPMTGWVQSIHDKVNDIEVLSGAGAVPVVINDPSDTWSHRVFKFKEEIGRFSDASVTVIENGPVRTRIRVKSYYGKSSMTQDFMIYDGLDYIECRAKVNWQEERKMLKLSFPVKAEEPEVSYEIPYGFIKRPADGEEEPGQQWVDATGKNEKGLYGLTVATDSVYSYDVEENDMRVTILRSPVFAQHDPNKPDPEEDYEYTDQGIFEFNYILYPHAGDWNGSFAVRRSHELNAPLSYIVDTWHEGTEPMSASFISIDAENVEATVVKMAEDADGVILRCYETAGKGTKAVIELPFVSCKFEAQFGPCEIKTFKIPFDAGKPVAETNLIEF